MQTLILQLYLRLQAEFFYVACSIKLFYRKILEIPILETHLFRTFLISKNVLSISIARNILELINLAYLPFFLKLFIPYHLCAISWSCITRVDN